MAISQTIQRITEIKFLTNNTFYIKVSRPDFIYKAGQCFSIGVPGYSVNREYSICSGEEDNFLGFLIRKVEDGVVSAALSKLSIGDEVEIDGPYGEFCITEPSKNSYFFIGTGTGIAPFASFIKTYKKLNYKILHGIRFYEEMYFKDIFKDKYIACISQNNNGESMRVTKYLKENHIDEYSKYYLCGNRDMIVEVSQILLDNGVNGNSIISEVFF